MAYTFPLSTADFWDIVPHHSLTFDPVEQAEIAETGGGEFMSADLGPQLWQGRIELGKMTPAEVYQVSPMINLLRGGGRTFYAYDKRRPRPLSDPTGAILGASTPTILSLNVNNRELALTGLPAGYVLQRGDKLAFNFTGGRALHEIVTPLVTANGSGQTPQFEVLPLILPGAATGAAITLIKPAAKCLIRPQSVNPGTSWHGHVDGLSFEFQQTLG